VEAITPGTYGSRAGTPDWLRDKRLARHSVFGLSSPPEGPTSNWAQTGSAAPLRFAKSRTEETQHEPLTESRHRLHGPLHYARGLDARDRSPGARRHGAGCSATGDIVRRAESDRTDRRTCLATGLNSAAAPIAPEDHPGARSACGADARPVLPSFSWARRSPLAAAAWRGDDRGNPCPPVWRPLCSLQVREARDGCDELRRLDRLRNMHLISR
jgi:hypothetical protein